MILPPLIFVTCHLHAHDSQVSASGWALPRGERRTAARLLDARAGERPRLATSTADAVIAPSEVSFLLIFSFKGAADSETSYGRLLSHSSPSNRQVLQGYVPRSQAGWPSFASVILLAQLLIVSFPRATTRMSGSLIHKWHVNDEQEDLASGPFPKSWRLTVHTSHTPPVVAKGFLISSQR